MTREKAKGFKWFQADRVEIYKHIDKIYDEHDREIFKRDTEIALLKGKIALLEEQS